MSEDHLQQQLFDDQQQYADADDQLELQQDAHRNLAKQDEEGEYQDVYHDGQDAQDLQDMHDGSGSGFVIREQDRWLPIANVARIMKNALPDNAKISKEAKECMQECVSEFISFVTSEATERCSAERRKTVNGEDILFALMSLGFENYSEVLKIYLTKYRESQSGKNKRSQDDTVNTTPDGEDDVEAD